MTLIHRRIIYLIFIIIFLLILPVVILHASGYRYNFKKNILQKTGIIFLESKPKDVEISLNQKPIGHKTPLRIKNLLPNEYEIELSKPGFYPWQKKITVYESQTTFLQYVRLFRQKTLPQLLLEGDILKIAENNGRDKLILVRAADGLPNKKYELILYDLNSHKQIDTFYAQQPIEHIKFVDNGQRIALNIANDLWLVDSNDFENIIKLRQKIVPKNADNIKLDKYNSNNIYYLKNSKLVRYNSVNKENLSFPFLMTDYFIADNYIYFLSNDSLNKTFLKKINILNTSSAETIATFNRLSGNNNYKIIDVGEQSVVMGYQNNLILYNITTGQKKLVKDADYFRWNNDQTQLIYIHQNELWLYRPAENNQFILLTRSGEKISQAGWYMPETHIYYSIGDKIKITENLENNRQTVDLISLATNVKNILLNKKADKIYFVAEIGEQQGLYEMQVQ